MTNIMLDLETLGVHPGSVILSIGMAVFDENAVFPETFYAEINKRSCLDAGLKVDPATELWWESRDHDAIDILRRVGLPIAKPLAEVLGMAKQFMDSAGVNIKVWGNGADFDLPILSAAYVACGYGKAPWAPYSGRCYRTLKELRPGIKIIRTGTHHNAVDDARSQAEHAVRLLNSLKSFPVAN